jgi:hypothetical protein
VRQTDHWQTRSNFFQQLYYVVVQPNEGAVSRRPSFSLSRRNSSASASASSVFQITPDTDTKKRAIVAEVHKLFPTLPRHLRPRDRCTVRRPHQRIRPENARHRRRREQPDASASAARLQRSGPALPSSPPPSRGRRTRRRVPCGTVRGHGGFHGGAGWTSRAGGWRASTPLWTASSPAAPPAASRPAATASPASPRAGMAEDQATRMLAFARGMCAALRDPGRRTNEADTHGCTLRPRAPRRQRLLRAAGEPAQAGTKMCR